MVYPDNISDRLARLANDRRDIVPSASATAANFCCGSFVRFLLSINKESRMVTSASFASNGCGFMLAAADVMAEYVYGRSLTDLHGLTDYDLTMHIQSNLGEMPEGRIECASVCIQSLRAAFADHRTSQIEEFLGEKALICTCFGVSEETIEGLIAEDSLNTVDEVTSICNAGGGCGSCRMLIQEMLDDREVNI
ncbi:MAG: (2Fe-2S)-binding protein [Chloracidobacterium sp.]|nr:(2Fe-2S)-binding protein [Chloracidobacterium sp.]